MSDTTIDLAVFAEAATNPEAVRAELRKMQNVVITVLRDMQDEAIAETGRVAEGINADMINTLVDACYALGNAFNDGNPELVLIEGQTFKGENRKYNTSVIAEVPRNVMGAFRALEDNEDVNDARDEVVFPGQAPFGFPVIATPKG